MAKDIGDVISALYNYVTTDKVIHAGNVTKSPFQVNDIITGSLSGASATITEVNSKYFKYNLSTDLKLKIGDVITGNISGASHIIVNLNELHTTIEDKIYFEEAEESNIDNLLPYIVFSISDSTPFIYYTGEYKTILLSFYAYSGQESSAQITSIDKQLNNLLNKDTELVITNWTFKSLLNRGTSKLFRDENKIWTCINDYEIVVQ